MWARVELEHSNFPAQRVSVNAEGARCAGLIALHVIEHLFYVALLKFIHSFRK